MENLFKQIMRFGFAGIICAMFDFAVFRMLDMLQVGYIAANIVSYICTIMVNYWMSMNFVFVRKQNWSRRREFLVFVLLGVAGLLINTASLWMLYHVFYNNVMAKKTEMSEEMGKLVCKAGATVILLIYNFVSRKIFLEKKN